MMLRPTDENGDILPVTDSASLLRGTQAAARLIRDRLELLTGDWWENSALGNGILQMMQESRLAEPDLQTLANSLASYIRQTPGVRDVRDASFSMEGRTFSFACTAETDDGEAVIEYSL